MGRIGADGTVGADGVSRHWWDGIRDGRDGSGCSGIRVPTPVVRGDRYRPMAAAVLRVAVLVRSRKSTEPVFPAGRPDRTVITPQPRRCELRRKVGMACATLFLTHRQLCRHCGEEKFSAIAGRLANTCRATPKSARTPMDGNQVGIDHCPCKDARRRDADGDRPAFPKIGATANPPSTKRQTPEHPALRHRLPHRPAASGGARQPAACARHVHHRSRPPTRVPRRVQEPAR